MKKSEESLQVTSGLSKLFASANDIFIDTTNKECEVSVSIDDFQGEIMERLVEDKVHYFMVDYCDTYPYKYVFSYQLG